MKSYLGPQNSKTEYSKGPHLFWALPVSLTPLQQPPHSDSSHFRPATFSPVVLRVTHLSSSAPLADNPRPHSSPPLIHPTWFSGSPYCHSPLSPVPSCPFWVAACGQAEVCGTVAAVGSKVTGDEVSLRASWDGLEGSSLSAERAKGAEACSSRLDWMNPKVLCSCVRSFHWKVWSVSEKEGDNLSFQLPRISK